jgi:hypothetical protein
MTTAFVEGLQKMSGVENSIKNCDKFNKNESLDDRTPLQTYQTESQAPRLYTP